MTPKKYDVDIELIEAATSVAKTRCRRDNHTVACAARCSGGQIVTAVNAYHFTGGPCAELVVIGSAASQGYYELERIVAVGDGDWRIVPPCGRCRQVLFDYFPTIEVIIRSSDNYLTYSIAELLPETFDWAKQDRQKTLERADGPRSDSRRTGAGGTGKSLGESFDGLSNQCWSDAGPDELDASRGA